MIKIENIEVTGWEAAIRGMRNSMNSWDKSDSVFVEDGEYHDICGDLDPSNFDVFTSLQNLILAGVDFSTINDNKIIMGTKDYELMMKLAKNGSVHAKYRRMITVYMDITAPLYWWKEFDTYKVGTVANSCSTMHKIHEKEFTINDFSYEHLGEFIANTDINKDEAFEYDDNKLFTAFDVLDLTVKVLNHYRQKYLETKDKKYWWQMIQLLPSSYEQKRTVMMNYEVLANIYHNRKDHKLDEWQEFCYCIRELPYSKLFIGAEKDNNDIPTETPNEKPIKGKYKYGNDIPKKSRELQKLNLLSHETRASLETLGKRFDLVEKHKDELKKNKFFDIGESILEIYYNPNTSSGGQFVINSIKPCEVINALKANNLYNNNFIQWLFDPTYGIGFSDLTYQNLWNTIRSTIHHHCVDIDDNKPDFDSHMKTFLNAEVLFEGKDYKDIVANILKFMDEKGVFNNDQL